MISLLDIAERTHTGEKVDDKNWDMGLFQKISELVKRYDIKFPGGHTFINTDDSLVERAFAAGLECLEGLGIFCLTTTRRGRLRRDHILTALREGTRGNSVGGGGGA